MSDNDDTAMVLSGISAQCASIVAPAGCGKTEQIARVIHATEGRRLVLTHTHAGVDAIRARLISLGVASGRYRLETIAGWCLRFAGSFPKSSGLGIFRPKTNREWEMIYNAAARLLRNGSMQRILQSSYSGVLVDEYQDCNGLQHSVIKAITDHLPVCVFGDPLQAIFDFKEQQPVDWETDVFPVFPKKGELSTPWRWNNAGNSELAGWLTNVRTLLQSCGKIDLRTAPSCIHWEQLPNEPQLKNAKVVSSCNSLLKELANSDIILIADAANSNQRAKFAQNLAKSGFSNLEPLGCKDLLAVATTLNNASGVNRLEVAMDFISSCMTNTEKSTFLGSVQARQQGKRKGTAKFGGAIELGLSMAECDEFQPMLDLMERFQRKDDTRLYRRERFYSMQSALRTKVIRPEISLSDAVLDVQNRIRHTGRKPRRRNVGSTLLVKGLQFDYAVVVFSPSFTNRDLYVALTRATKGATILAPSCVLEPKSTKS